MITPTNQHDSPPLHLTLERPSHLNLGLGAELPETITVHPNASHDSRATQTLLEDRLPSRDQPTRDPTGDRKTLTN